MGGGVLLSIHTKPLFKILMRLLAKDHSVTPEELRSLSPSEFHILTGVLKRKFGYFERESGEASDADAESQPLTAAE